MTKEKYVSVKTREETYIRLLAISKNEGMGVSDLIERAVDLYVSQVTIRDLTDDVEKQIYMLRKKVQEDIELNRTMYKLLKGL